MSHARVPPRVRHFRCSAAKPQGAVAPKSMRLVAGPPEIVKRPDSMSKLWLRAHTRHFRTAASRVDGAAGPRRPSRNGRSRNHGYPTSSRLCETLLRREVSSSKLRLALPSAIHRQYLPLLSSTHLFNLIAALGLECRRLSGTSTGCKRRLGESALSDPLVRVGLSQKSAWIA